MILIGSRATKFHFPDFREPKDWDFIVSESELSQFKKLGFKESNHPDKYVLRTSHYLAEIEVSRPGSSSDLLSQETEGEILTSFGICQILSPDALFLLKKSHIWHKHNWNKHFKDYRFLQNQLGSIPARLNDIFNLRVLETKKRLHFRDHSFDMSNSKFFEKSAHAIKRYVEHDKIHEAIKFNETPIFKLLKDDQSKANISFEKFQALSFEQKIQNMQEECMVLALERHLIPAHVNKIPVTENFALTDIMRQMCYNFLPFEFRFFAVDYFDIVLKTIPKNFSQLALQKLGL